MKAKWIARWGMTLVVLAAMWVMMGYGVGNVEGAQSTITVGRIIPVTGPLAGFGEGIPWIDEYKVNSVNKDGGLLIGNERYKIEYKIYDSKSTVAGSGEAATKAILKDKVDVLMALGAPDTTAAPADLAERHKIPCITTVAPVEAMLYGPDRKPKVFKYTFHFFLSVRDLVGNHLGLLKTVNNFNGKIGYLFPNDVDGMVFYQTFDPILKKEGLCSALPQLQISKTFFILLLNPASSPRWLSLIKPPSTSIASQQSEDRQMVFWASIPFHRLGPADPNTADTMPQL